MANNEFCDVVEPSKIKRMQELLDESYAKGFADGKEQGLRKKPQGHWIFEKIDESSSKTYCSCCKSSAPFICKSRDYYGNSMYGEIEKTKFCPNCGAEMEQV